MTGIPPGACNCCTECTGELIFTGGASPYPFTMHRQAWCLTDLSSLWELPNQRGANVIIPETPGRYPNPRRADETDYALPFVISGVVDEADVLASDENAQLRDNMAYLEQYVLSPPTPPATTRAAQLVSPDGMTTLDADVQFGDSPLVRRYKNSGLWIGTLHLVVPAGSFA